MSKVAFVNGLLIDGTGCEPIEKSLVLLTAICISQGI